MKKVVAIFTVLHLASCPLAVDEALNDAIVACHFDEVDIKISRPDGYPCSPARCSEDGASYTQRGSCFDLGTRCEVPKDPVLCAPDEVCLETPYGGNHTQAICIKK